VKPIKLTLSGLNSFREEQEIDFSHLCQGNVFGIFGSTGSGKSTIIDAITLALFGKVERAPGKVQGIVNKGSDAASVCFDFALAGAEETKVYRVERKYVIGKEGNIACRLARISELKYDGAVVLAEKISQVDAKVEEILGLTVDDFTRAVVLPQGKFAEFLSLKGTERREMLERIFNLGEFGEMLVNVASAEYKELDASVKALQAEQAGLGEASKEALELARASVTEATREALERQVTLDAHNRQMEQARVVVELQQAFCSAQLAQQQLDSEADIHAKIEQKLSKLTKAIGLEDSLKLCDESEQSFVVALEKSQTAAIKLQSARQTEEVCAQALQKAADERASREPSLTSLCHDLKRAMIQDNKLREYLAEEAKEMDVLRVAQSNLELLERQVEDFSRREKGASENLAMLTLEIRKCFVTPEIRSAIEQASKSEIDWKHAVSKQQEIKAELDQRSLALARSQQTLMEAQEKNRLAQSEHAQAKREYSELNSAEPPDVDSHQRDLVGRRRLQLEQLKALWAEQDRIASRREVVRKKSIELGLRSSELGKQLQFIKSQVLAAEHEVASAEAALKTSTHASMAVELARQLMLGEACPVCGSTEHPSPVAYGANKNIEKLNLEVQSARAEYTRLVQQSATKEAENQSLDKEQGDIAESLCNIDSELRRIQAEKDSISACFPPEWTHLAPAEIETKVLTQVQELEARTALRNAWLDDCNTKRLEEREKNNKLSLAQQALVVAEQSLAALTGEVATLSEKWKKAAAYASELQDVHAQALLALNTEDLAALKNKTAALDRRSRELTSTQQEMEQKRSELQAALRDLENKTVLERELISRAQSRVQSLQMQMTELTQEINTVTAGRPVEEVRQEAEGMLNKLRETEQLAQKQMSLARAEVDALAQETARSAAQLQAAEETREKAAQQLNRALADAGFSSREAVEEALDNRLYQAEWVKQIQNYQQKRLVIAAELERLTTALAGRHVSNEQWQSLNSTTATLKLAQESALQRQGQAQARLADIEARHVRFVELEKQKQHFIHERDLLQELVSLLRGNALVEFLATEHLQAIAGAATEWLRILTSERYALEVDPEGSFVIRDDGNGGQKRPVHTLSGGETFVASLALALALSAQIQLRGRYPLEFFFLDEGFGTLDPELLETVMTCLERMQGQHMSIGIISHVPELKERIQRKVLVTAADPGGRGSRLKVV